MTRFTLNADPRIATRQLGILARKGLRPATSNITPGRTIQVEPIPTTAPERPSNPNRPGGPRFTAQSQPRTFQQSMRMLQKMMMEST